MTERTTLRLAAAVLLTGALVAGLTACSGNSANPAPVPSDGQVPAPGSQPGLHAVADTDYEQITLGIDTQQIELAQLAKQAARQASPEVTAIADNTSSVIGIEAEALRAMLVENGDSLTHQHGDPSAAASAVAALKQLSGTAFDKAWAEAMITLNKAAIEAAVTEMNTGEDQETRAIARARIDQASAQNGNLEALLQS